MFRHPLLILLACSITLLLPLSTIAVGQQQFRLGEDDDWATPVGEDIEPGTPAWQIAEARRALAAGDYHRAQTLSSTFIDRNPRHQLLPEAYLIRADAKVARGNEYQALFDYEYIARSFYGHEVWLTALERELDIAKAYAQGKRRKFWGIRFMRAHDEAEELLIRIQERLPGSRLAEEAGMELADFYFRQRNMGLAAEAYDLFIENYPRSPDISKARRRLIYANLASFKGPRFDASGLYEARFHLQSLQRLEPYTAEEIGADALLLRIDESDAAKLLDSARWYHRTGDHISAELTLRRLLRRYPNTIAAREALDLGTRLLPNLPPRVQEQAPDYEALRSGYEQQIAAEEAEE